jgi:DNA-directed RNA polymerase subunit RPC12/RpoP
VAEITVTRRFQGEFISIWWEISKQGIAMFCSKCGKENEDDAEFCKHCGAKIAVEGKKPEDQVRPTEETKEPIAEGEPVEKKEELEKPKAPLEKKKPRRKLAVILIVIGLIMVSVLAWYIIAFEDVDEHVYYTYDPETAPDSLTVEIEMNGGGIEINFTTNFADPVVYIDYHKRWEGAVISQPSFSSSSTKVSFDSGTVWGESDSELTITLRSDVTYSFDTKTSNGGMNLVSDTPGTTFGTFTLDTLNGASNLFISHASVSGKIESTTENGGTNYHFTNCTLKNIVTSTTSGASTIFLENCIVGNIKSNVNSGGMVISSKDITITSNSTWNLKADKGGIGLNINQTTSLGADIKVNVEIEGREDITSYFAGNATLIRAKFTASASGGSATLANGVGFNAPDSGAMESSNYGNIALDQFLVELITSNGDIGIEAVNL